MFKIDEETRNRIRSDNYLTRYHACIAVLKENHIKHESIPRRAFSFVCTDKDSPTEEEKANFEMAIIELEKFVNDYGKPVNLKELSKEELNEYFYDLCSEPNSATLDVIRECFELGADFNFKTKYTGSSANAIQFTAFQYMCKTNDPEILREFLKRGANPNESFSSQFKQTAWTMAHSSNLNKIKVFLEYGAIVDDKGGNGNTALINVCCNSNSLEAVKYLIENGAQVNAKNKLNRTPLFSAVYSSNASIISYLIEKGANVNVVDNSGDSPLLYAVSLNRVEPIGILIGAGADKTFKNAKGKDAYELALDKGFNDIAKLIEPQKFEIDFMNRPEYQEISKCKKQIIEKLKSGKKFSTSDHEGAGVFGFLNGVFTYEYKDHCSVDSDYVSTYKTDDEALEFLFGQLNWQLYHGKTMVQVYQDLNDRIY